MRPSMEKWLAPGVLELCKYAINGIIIIMINNKS